MFHLRSSGARLEVVLTRRELLATDVAEPIVVTCLSGTLWLTARDTGDILLSSRQSVVVRGPCHLVLEALEPARVELWTPAQSLAA